MKKFCIVMTVLLNLSMKQASATDYLITAYGAVGNGSTNNTTFIQSAIDDCASHGGGRVIIPEGNFMSAMVSLKNNVELYLTAGARLTAIAGGPAYAALVRLYNIQNASITGKGILSGNGGSFPVEETPVIPRPYTVLVLSSKNIHIEDVQLIEAASWNLRLYRSEHVLVKGIYIYSQVNYTTDGIDIDGKDIVITGCNIDTDDDGICLKSDDSARATENIAITNCVIASNCNLIKMGTGSVSGFKNITISNCVLRAASVSTMRHWGDDPNHYIGLPITGISGIALEIVDGGVLDQVSISNISMTGVQTPVFIRLGSRKNPTGSLKNVIISNIVATSHSRMSSMICGVPNFKIYNVTLRDIILKSPGGGTQQDAARTVPEAEIYYPENRMFGWSVPASGLYARHVKNITIDNFQVELASTDQRPAFFLDDADLLKATNVKVNGAPISSSMVHLVNSTNCTVN